MNRYLRHQAKSIDLSEDAINLTPKKQYLWMGILNHEIKDR